MSLPLIFIAISIFYVIYQAYDLVSAGLKKTARARNSGQWRTTESIGSRMTFNQIFAQNEKVRTHYGTLLMRSGKVFGWNLMDVIFFKEVGLVVGIFYLYLIETTNPLALLALPTIGFMLPDIYLKQKGGMRAQEIRRNLPTFVNLMVLALESGLDLLAAAERVIDKMKPNALSEELQILIQENRLGTPRKEALERLATRTNIPDIQSLVSIIIQSEELGTSLATVLRSYAEDMRTRRILLAEEVAGKAPVKLLFPMVVFFFPIVFIIIFGPMAFNYMNGGQ